jgi:hypothetical protein
MVNHPSQREEYHIYAMPLTTMMKDLSSTIVFPPKEARGVQGFGGGGGDEKITKLYIYISLLLIKAVRVACRSAFVQSGSSITTLTC